MEMKGLDGPRIVDGRGDLGGFMRELGRNPLAHARNLKKVAPVVRPQLHGTDFNAGNEIGYITSGSPAPFLKKNIALAYVPPAFSAIDTVINVEIRGQKVKAKVVATPFYKKPKKAVASS